MKFRDNHAASDVLSAMTAVGAFTIGTLAAHFQQPLVWGLLAPWLILILWLRMR